MTNPFESGEIKNYLLLYAAVIVIVVLFFVASSLFLENEQKEKRVFASEVKTQKVEVKNETNASEAPQEPSFKLLEKGY